MPTAHSWKFTEKSTRFTPPNKSTSMQRNQHPKSPNLDPTMPPTSTSTEAYDKWHDRVHGTEALDKTILQPWHRDALSLHDIVQDQVTLEIGCGAGDFSNHLAKLGAHVTGIDFSPTAVEIAGSKAKAQSLPTKFLVADAQHLPFENETFDLIFSCECLEHIPNPKLALSEMYRVLKPQGHLILTTENYSNAMILYWAIAWLRGRKFDSGAGVQPIENFFLYWRVLKMMRQVGFQQAKLKGATFVFFALPGISRNTFVRQTIDSPLLQRILLPFARHISYSLLKPDIDYPSATPKQNPST
jgi:ubiquinone/menaquinone biosynthesis C-methylase UbiE